MTELIDIVFGVQTPVDPRNIALEASHPPTVRGRGSMRPLPNYFDHLLNIT